MLTISKPLSATQAQNYHQKEFTAKEQNYWSQRGEVAGEWQGRLAAKFGLAGAVAAEDFARTVLVRKMEGDISRLEGLNSGNKPPASVPAWTTTQQPAPKKKPKSPRDENEAGNAQCELVPHDQRRHHLDAR